MKGLDEWEWRLLRESVTRQPIVYRNDCADYADACGAADRLVARGLISIVEIPPLEAGRRANGCIVSELGRLAFRLELAVRGVRL